MDNHNYKVPESAALLRNVVAIPNTAAARLNDHLLRSHTAAVGYNTVAAAIGSDKTQVCRFLTGERPAYWPQMLHWFDTVTLRLSPADDGDEREVIQELLEQAASVVDGMETRKSELSTEEVEALLKVAKLYIGSRMRGGQ